MCFLCCITIKLKLYDFKNDFFILIIICISFGTLLFLLSDKNDPQATIWRIYIDKSAAGHVDIIGEIPDTLFITLKLYPVCLNIYIIHELENLI